MVFLLKRAFGDFSDWNKAAQRLTVIYDELCFKTVEKE